MTERLQQILATLMDTAFRVKGSEALPVYHAVMEEINAAKPSENDQKVEIFLKNKDEAEEKKAK
jgi:hypothetical protein